MFFFFSEGSPNDKGLSLTHNKDLLITKAQKHFDKITYYTPSILRNMGYDSYIKEREPGLVSRNRGMSNIGNSAWRPLILLLELEKMNDGDILLYRDCNISKYPILGEYDNIKDIMEHCLNITKFDFFIPRETISGNDFVLKYYCKTNIIRELGENHPFIYEFPLCFSGLLTICRKSHISIELLQEWKTACEKEEWIDGKQYGELYNEFRWSTPEQSILCVIIANWIRKRKHNIPFHYPKITFINRNINQCKIIRDYEYLKYLNFNSVNKTDVINESKLSKLSNNGIIDYNKTFYICSYGGCGSSMLTESLKKYGNAEHIHSRYPPKELEFIGKQNGGTAHFEKFNGIKIPNSHIDNYYVIYIYRNPVKAIFSRFKRQGHLKNIETNTITTTDDVINQMKDLYELTEFYNNYTTPNKRNYKIYCVRYEEIFEKQNELSQILGIGPLNLVQKPPRRHYDKEVFYKLYAVYIDLIKRMDKNKFIEVR